MKTTIDNQRTRKFSTTAEDYVNFADRLVEETSCISGVSSIVICGSFAKDTLVPGWSDIDIIYFVEDQKSPINTYRKIGKVVRTLQMDRPILVGLDIASSREFQKTWKIGMRALGMTFEVAGSGKTVFGDCLMEQVVWNEKYRLQIKTEATNLMRAHLHEWRRWYINTSIDYESNDHLRKNVVTCLKICKLSTDPNLQAPFSYEQCVNVMRGNGNPEAETNILSLAVETRRNWQDISEKPKEVAMRNRVLSEAIAKIRR
ncbi:nucleotidyltransferase domain-containing protein [Rhodobacteraceae bacterium]|nr:nucleotidyltransferase domain-containing protein [Paracoccaceae bacterium]